MNNTMSTGNEIEDINEITPLLANQRLLPDANENSNEISVAGADRKAVNLFPSKLIVFISTCLTLLSVTMIVLERIQEDRFSLDDISIISYKTLNGFILWASIIMLVYSVVSLFTVFFQYILLIQILTMLHLVGVFMSLFIQILFNLVVLVFSILGTQASFNYIPILYRSSMVLIGGIMIILNLVFFLYVQFNYLREV